MRGRIMCWRWYLLERRPLVNPSMNGRSHSGISVTTLRIWSPTAGVRFRVPRACLHASDNQKHVVVGFALDVSPILDEMGWLTWMPFIRTTIFVTQFSCESTTGDSLNKSTETNTSKS